VRELRIGEEVVDPQGRRLGTIQRLVVDERAHRVTHLVVDGRLVGAQRIREAGDRLQANLEPDELRREPEAQDHLVAPPGDHWRPPDGYALDNFMRVFGALLGPGGLYVPPVHLDLDLSAIHEITPGSEVYSGIEKLGEVERVLTDDAGDISSLVVRRRGLRGRRVVMPVDHVNEVVGSSVHVDLDEEGLERLPEFEV
jgi:uncharacterized protein YrrD